MLKVLLGSRVRANALGWLLCHPDERFFVRQLQHLVHEDSTNLSRELAKLESIGILTSHVEGRQRYYQANKTCPIFPELKGLVAKTVGVADVLREALMPLKDRIRVAFVYGSVAAGHPTADSDIDLMVIGELDFGDVVSAVGPAQRQLGREVNPTVYPVAEYVSKQRAGHHFLKSVVSSPKLYLFGDDHELGRLVSKRLARATRQ